MQKRYIQYINLPRIPDHIIDKIPLDPNMYTTWADGSNNFETYKWSDMYCQELNEWCRQHVCEDMYFGLQMMFGHNQRHKDKETLTKINYVITTGGQNVTTAFYDDMQSDLASESYLIEPHRWHIFKADAYHQVHNLDPGQVRFGVTGRIF